jgi:hypothetical protein
MFDVTVALGYKIIENRKETEKGKAAVKKIEE